MGYSLKTSYLILICNYVFYIYTEKKSADSYFVIKMRIFSE